MLEVRSHLGNLLIVVGQGVIPQSVINSSIIVSRCYNELNVFVRLTAYSTKKTLPYGQRRLRLKTYNRCKATVTSTVGIVNLMLRRQNVILLDETEFIFDVSGVYNRLKVVSRNAYKY